MQTMCKSFPVLILLFLVSGIGIQAQVNPTTTDANKMQWFSDAKLGIFIHWGIYSTGKTSESWEFYNKHISHKDYMAQINEFTATNYKPEQWTALIKSSGAKYVVITSKHHDGVALWNTKMNDLSIPKKSPAKKDVLTPFVNQLREDSLKVGLYYSLIDWTYPDYPGFLRDSSKYKIENDTARWVHFLKFCHGQIAELLKAYNPDLVWFDGDWEHNAEEWQAAKIRQMILTNNPSTIINGRLQGYGDYDTPEQSFPVTRPAMKNWELCMTTNDSWGYYIGDKSYKTPYEIISIFADCISMGGNLLLDIGPREDGSIPEEQQFLLTTLGKWTNKHSEAIFGTLGGLPPGYFYGPTTLSKDSCNLYLFLQGRQSGSIILKGITNDIKNIEVVGNKTKLSHKVIGKMSWSDVPGLVYIDIPEGVQDEYMTVVKVTFDKPVSLYKAKGGL